jgi:hypothetical protein
MFRGAFACSVRGSPIALLGGVQAFDAGRGNAAKDRFHVREINPLGVDEGVLSSGVQKMNSPKTSSPPTVPAMPVERE